MDPSTQAHSQDYLKGWNDCHAHMAEEIVRQDDRIAELENATSIPPVVTIHALGHDPTNLYGISPEDWSLCTVHVEAQRRQILELKVENDALAAVADEHVNTAHRYRDALEGIENLCAVDPKLNGGLIHETAKSALETP